MKLYKNPLNCKINESNNDHYFIGFVFIWVMGFVVFCGITSAIVIHFIELKKPFLSLISFILGVIFIKFFAHVCFVNILPEMYEDNVEEGETDVNELARKMKEERIRQVSNGRYMQKTKR